MLVVIGIIVHCILLIFQCEKYKSKKILSEINYNTYCLKISEVLLSSLLGGVPFLLIGYLFYHDWIFSWMLSLIGAYCAPKWYQEKRKIRRKDRLSLQFKYALQSLSTALAVGKSVENAFIESIADLKLIYISQDAELIQEFSTIHRKMQNGIPIEQAVQQFANRSGITDIIYFSDVFTTCKRLGGNLAEILRNTSTMMSEKLENQEEIMVLVAQKKLEGQILICAPFVFILFLAFSAPDYIMPLYADEGRIVATICLALLVGCYMWMKKIVEIRC